MRQALHIFRKDVRHLRPQIAVALAVQGATAWLDAASNAYWQLENLSRGPIREALAIGLVMAWWYLIADAVHAEALAGDRQFWVTRPYCRGSLLAAKLLFVAAFVNLPLLAADCFTLAAAGFSPAACVSGLLWKQLATTVVLLIPALALASATANLKQMAPAALALFGAAAVAMTIVARKPLGWGGSEWLQEPVLGTILLPAAAIAVWWQCGRRGTRAARLLLAGGAAAASVVLIALPWPAVFALQAAFSGEASAAAGVRLRYQPSPAPPVGPRDPALPGDTFLEIRLAVEGLAPGLEIVSDRVEFRLESNGRRWSSGWTSNAWLSPGPSWADFHMPASEFAVFARTPVRLRADLSFTVFCTDSEVDLEPGGPAAEVRGGGRCRIERRPFFPAAFVSCSFPLREPPRLSLSGGSGAVLASSYSPLPRWLGLNPVASRGALLRLPEAAVRVRLQRPIAHIRRRFEVDLPRLADFVVAR